MKRFIFLLFATLLVPLAAWAAQPSPLGLWTTKKQDVAVHIVPCGPALCGYIVWLRADVAPLDAGGKPLCHAQVLSGFMPAHNTSGVWTGGTIYRPDQGTSYSGEIRQLDASTMELRGYLGLPSLGKDKKMHRVARENYSDCGRS